MVYFGIYNGIGSAKYKYGTSGDSVFSDFTIQLSHERPYIHCFPFPPPSIAID